MFLSYYYDIERHSNNKYIWYNIILILLIVIAGMRYRLGTDTIMYLNHFYGGKIPLLKDYKLSDFGSNPLWVLLNSVILSTFGKFYLVQFVQSSFVNILLFNYIKRHSKYIFTCVFLYYIWMYTNQNMEILKAGFSITICFYAHDYVLEKKWKKAYLLFLIAVLFHPSTLLIGAMGVIPLFMSIRLNKVVMCVLLAMLFVGMIIPSTIKDFLYLFEGDDAIQNKVEDYMEASEYIGQEKKFVYMLVHNYIFLIYTLITVYYAKKYIKDANLQKYEPYIVFVLLFWILQINVQIMYRFAQFYYIYVIFYFSNVFVSIARNNKLRYDGSGLLKAVLLFFPLLFCISYSYKRKYFRYYPYTSIIERKIDRKREHSREQNHPWEPIANRNQY